jgi:hypothetical protein
MWPVTSVNKAYTREIKRNLNYSAMWLPSVKVELGTVGTLTGYEFKEVTTLGELGITFIVSPQGAKGTIQHNTSGAVAINFKAAGQVLEGSSLGINDAGAVVNFGRGRAICFQASGCQSPTIQNTFELLDQILKAYERGSWKREYVLVTEVIRATATTVLISNGDGAKIELRANGNVGPAGLSLVILDAAFSIQHELRMETKILAKGELRPLFRSCALRNRPFSPRLLQKDSVPFEDLLEIDYDEFDLGGENDDVGSPAKKSP